MCRFSFSKEGIEYCHLASATPRSSRRLNAHTFEQPPPPWATAMRLPFTRTETQNKASARFRGNWAEFKMRQNFPVQQEEAATAGKGALSRILTDATLHQSARHTLPRKHHALMY